MKMNTGGVYLSSPAGLVGWQIDRNLDLTQQTVSARQFALDSDIVLGALAGKNSIFVIGRERILPIQQLPPLRFETIDLLASAKTAELAQSYERTDFVAGKFDPKSSRDWAPIFLSDELVDTEYGSLLNITDQLLKGWSQAGLVKYDNFDYPTPPGDYPFHQKPLSALVKAESVTFNWNTSGFGLADDNGELNIVTGYRTGALPITYLAESEGLSNEHEKELLKLGDDAYKYFATRGDPNLARVVSYALLYQVFQKFPVVATRVYPTIHIGYGGLAHTIEKILQDFATGTPEQTDARIKNLSDDNVSRQDLLLATLDMNHIAEVQKLLRDSTKLLGNDALAEIAATIANPRGGTGRHAIQHFVDRVKSAPVEKQKELFSVLDSAPKALTLLNANPPSPFISGLTSQELHALSIFIVARELEHHSAVIRILSGVPLSELKDSYEQAMNRPDTGWIKTPTLVVSRPTGELRQHTGGHDLDAAVVSFRADRSLQPRSVRVQREASNLVIRYNPGDEANLPEIARLSGVVGKAVSPAILERALNSVIKDLPIPPIRSREQTLGFSPSFHPQVSRGFQVPAISSEANPTLTGYTTTDLRPSNDTLAIARTAALPKIKTVVVERRKDGSVLLLKDGSSRPLLASDNSSAIGALVDLARTPTSPGQTTRIVFKSGFQEHEMIGYLESVRVKTESKVEGLGTLAETATNEDLAPLFRDARYAWDQVKITETEVPVSEIADTRQVNLEVAAPAIDPTARGFFFKLKVFFRGTVENVTAAMNEIRAYVNSFLRGVPAAPNLKSDHDIAAALVSSLREKYRGTNVDFRLHVRQQTKDILVVQNPRKGQGCAPPWQKKHSAALPVAA